MLVTTAGAVAQPAPVAPNPEVVTAPDWLRKPTGDDLARVYPKKAVADLLNGSATMSCGVTGEGRLANCSVIAEIPAGSGFGEAAIKLAPTFRMRPTTAAGTPVGGGTVRIPIIFRIPGGPISVFTNPPWRSTPTAAQVRVAYPAAAAGIAGGSAMVRCSFRPDGATHDCSVQSQSPARMGFGPAAVALAKMFVIRPTFGMPPTTLLFADIPIAFHNPAISQEPPKWAPEWVTTLSPAGAAKLYPATATAAKVSTGLGVVNCAVNVAGQLVDCRMQSETPAGVGFGDAALEAAKVMTLNPWTDAGEPLDGQRITLPIRLKLDEPAPAAPAPAQP